jgi:lysozyme
MPNGLRGLDVSSYQGLVDWAGVASSGLSYAYVKATEGLTVNDAQFTRNWQVSKQRGIYRGAYHFFHFSDDPIAQADFFVASANPQPGDLPPAVDVETTDGISDVTQLVQKLSAFITEVENNLGGKKMVIYTYYGFWNASMNGSDAFSGHPFWIAEYNNDNAPTLPHGWNDWLIWQYASNGTVTGVNTSVDLNVLNGDANTLSGILL